MAALTNALTALQGLSVAGIAHHYGPGALPAALTRAHLPALMIVPGEGGGQALFGPRAEGFSAVAFPGGARTWALTVRHMLVCAPADDGLGARTHWPGVIALLDAYFTALAAVPTLGGALREPARVTAEIGEVRIGAGRFAGATLRHHWLLTY